MKAQVISFNCVLRDPLGQVISSSFNHDVLARPPSTSSETLVTGASPYVSHFDFHEPIQGLVEGLQGLKKGERRTICVRAERAYGLYDPSLVMRVSRKRLPDGERLEVGFQVITQSRDGECRVFRVIEAGASKVTLDGNHPLAGQDLRFEIEATATREATEEDLAQEKAPWPGAPLLH